MIRIGYRGDGAEGRGWRGPVYRSSDLLPPRSTSYGRDRGDRTPDQNRMDLRTRMWMRDAAEPLRRTGGRRNQSHAKSVCFADYRSKRHGAGRFRGFWRCWCSCRFGRNVRWRSGREPGTSSSQASPGSASTYSGHRRKARLHALRATLGAARRLEMLVVVSGRVLFQTEHRRGQLYCVGAQEHRIDALRQVRGKRQRLNSARACVRCRLTTRAGSRPRARRRRRRPAPGAFRRLSSGRQPG